MFYRPLFSEAFAFVPIRVFHYYKFMNFIRANNKCIEQKELNYFSSGRIGFMAKLV